MFSYIKSVLFGDEVQQNHRQNSATREVNKLQIQVKQRTQYSQDSRLNTTSAALQSKTQPPLNKLDSARGINKSLNFPIKNAINADNSKEISLTNKKNTLQIELIKKQQLKQYDSSQVSSNNQSSVDLQAHMNSAKLQKTLVHPTLIASATNNLNQNLQNNGGTTKQIGRMNINPNSLLNAQKNRNSSLQNNNQIANNFTSTTSDLKFKLNQQLQQTLKVQDFKLNLQSKANQKAEFRLVNHQNLQIDKQLDSSNYQLQSQSIEGSMNIVDSIDANNNNDTFRNDMGGMSIDFKSQSAVAFKNQKYSQYNSNQPSINAGAADKPPSGKKQSSNKSNGGIYSRNLNMASFGQHIHDNQVIAEFIAVDPQQDDEIMLSEYQQMRAAMNGPEAPTVPQSAYVSILGSGFSNVKDKQSRGGIDRSNEKSSFVILNMKGQQRSNNKSNTLNYNNLQHGIENDLNHNEYYQNSYGDSYISNTLVHNNLGSTQKLPLMEPYMSKQGDQMVASRQAFEDEYNDENDNGNQIEDRKETEQLPITKDMLMGISNDRYADKRLNDQDRDADDLGSSDEDEDISDSEKLIYIQPNQRIKNSHHQNVYDSSEEMNGVEIEFNEMEKTVAQKSIRRSVVKDKLNWSCQFGQGVLSKNTKTLDGIQKLFMDSRGAQQAVNALKNKRQYHISQNTLLFELSMPNKDLKFISVNMLCKNLKMIDLQNNKLQSLPEEISDLMFLEKLRVDNNHLKSLPTKLSYLNMLETLTISNNQISELPENLEELSKLKILLLNDNKIKQLTSRIGNLQMLKKLFLHNNLFSEIPTEIYKLSKLKEFSSEWFLYLKPPMPRIMRDQQGLVIIEKIKNFCRSHSLFTSQNSITSVEQLQQTFQNQQTQLPEYKSFCDFILYYYKLKPSNINSLSFGQKQRGLIHQICINQHAHLLANVLNCGQEHSSSAQIVAKYLDLNQKDKEGSTAICFAFRQGQDDILNLFLSQNQSRLDLNIITLKYGAPLHMCILKHKFDLAMQLIDDKNINPHSLNANGSNAMHVLFANFMYDEVSGEKLARKLIERQVNINLVDTNGLTPLHVAIKKLQIKALEFAHKFNQMSGPPVQLTHNTCHKSQRFDFNSKGKKKLTPLHYSIAKTNFESFIFLLRQNLCDIWALDDQYRTPRSVALINSAFYKILFKMERMFIYEKAIQIFIQIDIERVRQMPTQRNNLRKGSYNIKNNGKHQLIETQQRSISDLQRNLESRHQSNQSEIIQHLNLTKRYILQPNLIQKNMEQIKGQVNATDSKILMLKKRHLISDKQKQSSISIMQPTQRVSIKKSEKIIGQEEIKTNKDIKKMSFDYRQQRPKPTQNIAHHQFMIKDDSSQNMQFQQQQQISQGNNIVNNIFISNLNINVNLNINISIPPSPMSTKGNGSRLESIQSQEELKDGGKNKQQDFNKSNNLKQSQKLINELSPQYSQKMMQQDQSMRYEDLSVIDDEMPIQNKINKNLKPDQIQGIIEQISPEIYKGLTNSLVNQSNSPQHQNNNIFINMCSINNPKTERLQSFEKPEDIESSNIKMTPRMLNTSKVYLNQQTQKFQQNNNLTEQEQLMMRRNFSQILSEEPIHICHNIQEEKVSSRKNNFNSQSHSDKTFMSYLSNNQKFMSIDGGDKEIQKNQFFKDYLVLSSEKELMSVKYQTLYGKMALCQITKDETIIKDALEIILKLIKQLSFKSPFINDLIYLLSQLTNFNGQAQTYLDEAEKHLLNQNNKIDQNLGSQLSKSNKWNSLLVNMELINGQIISQQNLKNQPKYPQKSIKLNQYLQENKKIVPSSQSRTALLESNYNQTSTQEKLLSRAQNEYLSDQNVAKTNRAHPINHSSSNFISGNNQSNNLIQQSNQHQRQMTHDSKPSQRYKLNQQHTSEAMNIQVLDDTTVVTERLGGTLKLNQLKIINSQAHTVISPAIKDRNYTQKLNNFASVRNSQQPEQKINRANTDKHSSSSLNSKTGKGSSLVSNLQQQNNINGQSTRRLVTQKNQNINKITLV